MMNTFLNSISIVTPLIETVCFYIVTVLLIGVFLWTSQSGTEDVFSTQCMVTGILVAWILFRRSILRAS